MPQLIPQGVAVDRIEKLVEDGWRYIRQRMGAIPGRQRVKRGHRLRPEFICVDQRHDLPDELRKGRAGVIVDHFPHGGFCPVIPVVKDQRFNTSGPVGGHIVSRDGSGSHVFRLVIGRVEHTPGRIQDLGIHIERQPSGGVIRS